MAMTLLQLVQEVAGRLGQPVPTYIAGNPDAGVLQMKGLLNEFCEDLLTRKYWQRHTIETVFTATAAEDQGSIQTLCPNGYEGIVKDTFFNRTQLLSVAGGISPSQWQEQKTLNLSGPYPSFRLRGDRLLFVPAPTAGHIYAFEYFSSYFVYNSVDGVYKPYWTKDTDTFPLGDAMPMAWLTWAWKERKGLDYAEAFRKYETLLAAKSARESVPETLNMGCTTPRYGPGIVVSPGSWPL